MTTSYFLTAVSHHGSSDCLLYERYPIRRYLCRSAKLLAAAVVFITYKWKHQTLIFILLGTISYMMLLHLF